MEGYRDEDELEYEDIEYLIEESHFGDHILDTEENETIKCNLCPQSVQKDQLQAHMEAEHFNYECEKCSKRYYSESMLRKHLRHAHLASMNLKCPFCDIVLKTKYSLQQHIYTHSSTAQFKCSFPHCNKAFKHVNTLKQHEKVHEGRNRRECPVCHEQVTRLSAHILTHTGERPHCCDLCNRSYLSKQQLNVHRASHFADGYLCENCNLRFKSMPSLYKHQRSIHADSTFTCPGCDKTYNRRDNMVSHARRAHPDSVLVQDMMRSSRCILVPS
ncbi:unnamed protein product [Hermetia illucens]|uniref:C2H2-type domain-containing protein n=1 Tax=Hermetia illucens TaxID=343691 RepID=A0A7R8V5L1_HERIL|nr:zinc finger protein 39-like isoform X2 [Hermetia illucens]CAD7093296.1 unnamed protein product [Hermetia illucens]